MTDFTSTNKKKNDEAMIQMIQSLNAVLYGDSAAYGKCIQVIEDMERELRETDEAISTLKEKLDSKTTQLERTEKNLGESLKTIVDATHEFGRTNEKLLKMSDAKNRLFAEILMKTKFFESTDGKSSEHSADKEDFSTPEEEKMLKEFVLAAEFLEKARNRMPEQSIGLAKLVLELEKCRTQCMEKEGESSVGEKARKEIASFGADFRSSWMSLETHSAAMDEIVSCIAIEIWMMDFDGYFEEEKKNSGEEEWMEYL